VVVEEANVVIEYYGRGRQRLEKLMHEPGVAIQKSLVPDIVSPIRREEDRGQQFAAVWMLVAEMWNPLRALDGVGKETPTGTNIVAYSGCYPGCWSVPA